MRQAVFLVERSLKDSNTYLAGPARVQFQALSPIQSQRKHNIQRGDGKRARSLLSRFTNRSHSSHSINEIDSARFFTHKYVFRKLEPEVNQLLIELPVHPLHRPNQGGRYIIFVCGTQKDGGCQAPQPAFSLRAFQNSEKCQELLTHTTVSVCEFSKLQTSSDVMTYNAMVSLDPAASKEFLWWRDHFHAGMTVLGYGRSGDRNRCHMQGIRKYC